MLMRASSLVPLLLSIFAACSDGADPEATGSGDPCTMPVLTDAPAPASALTTFFYDRVRADGAVQRTATPFVLRYTGRFELQLLLERAGFTGVTFYGSYDLEPFTAASERMIAIATRAS